MALSRFLLATIILVFSLPLAAQIPAPSRPRISPPPSTLGLPQPIPAKPKVLQPVRDPEAVTVVQAAIAALGGDAAIAQVQSWRAQGQAKAPKEMGGGDSTITWERAGAEFRMESAAGGKSTAVVTGRGRPATVTDGVGRELPEHVLKALFVPALVGSILRDDLQNANSLIRYAGPSTLDGKNVSVVRTASMRPEGTYIIGRTWYFDLATSLPLRVEYGVPALQTTQTWHQAAVDLSDFRTVAGVLYPFKIVAYQQGREQQTVTLQSIDANASIAPSDFDAPLGGVR